MLAKRLRHRLNKGVRHRLDRMFQQGLDDTLHHGLDKASGQPVKIPGSAPLQSAWGHISGDH